MLWDRRTLLAAGLAGAGLSLLPAVSRARAETCVFPPSETIHYKILRKGDKLGEHIASFTRDGNTLIARNDMEIVARLLGIPVYRYEHTSEEIWNDGWLTAVRSKTNKDGKKKRLEGSRSDHALRYTADGQKRTLSGYVLTTSLWHRDTPHERNLLDIEDGDVKTVQGHLVGTEEVPVAGNMVQAKHFRLASGGRDAWREVWYDDACRLVRVEFENGKDGSRITLEPKKISA